MTSSFKGLANIRRWIQFGNLKGKGKSNLTIHCNSNNFLVVDDKVFKYLYD